MTIVGQHKRIAKQHNQNSRTAQRIKAQQDSTTEYCRVQFNTHVPVHLTSSSAALVDAQREQ
jgi:hypothetical protein